MQKIDIEFEGEDFKVVAKKVNGQLWFHHQGKTYCHELENRSARKSSHQDLNPNEVLAPMPGKVLKLNFQKGDSVKVGQTVVIMEAMKMEYNLEAKIDGAIEYISCQVNDQVSKDQILVKIKDDSK